MEKNRHISEARSAILSVVGALIETTSAIIKILNVPMPPDKGPDMNKTVVYFPGKHNGNCDTDNQIANLNNALTKDVSCKCEDKIGNNGLADADVNIASRYFIFLLQKISKFLTWAFLSADSLIQ